MSAGYDDRDDDRYGDRYGDRYDDRPRRRPRDDDGYDDRPRRRGPAAAGRAALPGLFLIVNGLAGIVVWVGLAGVALADPMLGVEFLRKVAADQPDPQQRKELEDEAQELEDQLKANPGANAVGTVVEAVIGIGLNALAVVGGIMMRSGRGWGLGLAGSAVTAIPCLTGCCVTGIPFGIWGVVVLLDADVKAAFARNRRRYDEG